MTIDQARIEAVAFAIFRGQYPNTGIVWPGLSSHAQDCFRRDARAAIEADPAIGEMATLILDFEMYYPMGTNPYLDRIANRARALLTKYGQS